MSSDTLKLARIQRQQAGLDLAKQALFNPVVELLAGMAVIDHMYPQGETSAEIVTTTNKPNFGNPLWFLTELFGSKETTTTTEIRNTANDRAKNALMWVILAQQLAPAVPGIVQGVGSLAGGLLTKGVTK